MAYDNRPLLVESNRAGILCRAEQLDRAKSVLGLSYVIASGATPATVTGTLAETTLLTCPIPGGLLGLNGALRVSTLWSMTGSVNNKIFRHRFGAADFMSGRTVAVAATVAMAAQRIIQNRGSESSQVYYSNWADLGSNTAANQTAAVDTSVDQVLTITAMLANVGEFVTLESWLVEVIPS